ncbi:MoaD/ThiS family protein [Rhodopirellula sallentina]|uniref:Molybdopterin converting factor, subunit 1 n=1 Tax=Rhodopirellula sallentina SM41 TaxID=1263870 RepID=M5UKU9_9BACT|nr:MoaD/ThiS family protein [Rhodopirellula sallentina]EMI58486.1 molybdopterin converting factor, subunit 1 [Rhodopirellula sallentina SM41]
MQPTPSDHPSVAGELRVLVFGPQAKTAGVDCLRLGTINFPIRADEVLSMIAEQYPEIAPTLGVSRVAINHEFAESGSVIKPSDEVALIGLISGG